MRRDYIDIVGDYIPRGQRHYKLRQPVGCLRLSVRSMASLREAAAAGDRAALSTLRGQASSS